MFRPDCKKKKKNPGNNVRTTTTADRHNVLYQLFKYHKQHSMICYNSNKPSKNKLMQ